MVAPILHELLREAGFGIDYLPGCSSLEVPL